MLPAVATEFEAMRPNGPNGGLTVGFVMFCAGAAMLLSQGMGWECRPLPSQY